LENEGVNCEHTQVKKNDFSIDDQMYNNCKSVFFNVSYSLHPKNNVMKAKKVIDCNECEEYPLGKRHSSCQLVIN